MSVRSSVGIDRRIPTWAAGVLARLAQDRPRVLTRADIGKYLAEAASDRDIERTIHELQRLGWITPLRLKGVWAYLPPGEAEVIDPYIDLRAWRARNPTATFALAGEAAAWHLGYLARAFDGAVSVWVPIGARVPHGLRTHVSVVTLGWGADMAQRLGPSPALLHRRRLDLTAWASGLPAFGPDALVVQLAGRPASFRAWADLVPNLSQLVEDCDPALLKELLTGHSVATWQRAAYLVHRGGGDDLAAVLLAGRPPGKMQHVAMGTGDNADWSREFAVSDRLVARLQRVLGKA